MDGPPGATPITQSSPPSQVGRYASRFPSKWSLVIFLIGLVACATSAGILALKFVRPPATPKTEALFPGILYERQVKTEPRPLVIHIVKVDLRQEGLTFLVTPGNPEAELPLSARTTSKFLREFHLQVAINGDGATPWYSRGPLDYYPRSGDPVAPIGLAASQGNIYFQPKIEHPTLYISKTNRARFNRPEGNIYNAISGTVMVLERGLLTPATQDERPESGANITEPRTAVALDQRNRELILVVVDGRQPGYSEGVTLAELAVILQGIGAYTAMNLDGGGSSTLVVEGTLGQPKVLNSPIDQGWPGRERPTGNHLGISISH